MSSQQLPKSEQIPGWAFNMMRLTMSFRDLFAKPTAKLNRFGIQPGSTIIDYGCGPGRYLRTESKLVGINGSVYAVDIHDNAINCASRIKQKHSIANLKVVKATGYFVPIQENTADQILVLDVFHMISEPGLFLDELHRLLKPKGQLILEDGHQSRDKTKAKVEETRRWKIIGEERKYITCIPLWKY